MAGHREPLEPRMRSSIVRLSGAPYRLHGSRHVVDNIDRDAGVFMELADYAERNGLDFDRQLVRELHSDALQLRIAALKTFLIRAPLA